MVGKHAVVLEIFDSRSRLTDWKFEKLQVRASVINLPLNLRYLPWLKKISVMLEEVIKVDVDAKGFAFGELLRARFELR